jgi:hypothetical protein
MSETFRGNNFAYTGERDDVHVTVLENNYINPYRPGTYEASLTYLIRERGELRVQTECHRLGLFPRAAWEAVFLGAGISLVISDIHGGYEENLIGEGEYPQHMFVGIRKVEQRIQSRTGETT